MTQPKRPPCATVRFSARTIFTSSYKTTALREQAHINPQIIRLSKDTGIPLVVTNDCHYIEKEDTKMHHILVCIQTNRTVEDEDTLEFRLR